MPRGVSDIAATVKLANDAGDPVGSYLVAPDGDALGYGQNQDPLTGNESTGLTAYTVDPTPGTWTLVVDFAEPVEGNELADPYTGTVTFNATSASAPGLPDSARTRLAAGTPVTIPVTVTNNGPEPEDFFVDPRLDTDTSLTLASLTSGSSVPLPPTTVSLPRLDAYSRSPLPMPATKGAKVRTIGMNRAGSAMRVRKNSVSLRSARPTR